MTATMKIIRRLGGRAWWDYYCHACSTSLKCIGRGVYTHPLQHVWWNRKPVNCQFAGKVVTIESEIVEEVEFV